MKFYIYTDGGGEVSGEGGGNRWEQKKEGK